MNTAGLHHRRDDCRACGSTSLETVIKLGPQPLANRLLESLDAADREPRFPLDLVFCRDCGLAQILDVIDPKLLFSHYLYVSGTSSSMARHWKAYASWCMQSLDVSPGSLVVEVASNDGSLLRHFRDLGCRVAGVEPARNIAKMARDRGIETVCAFFDESVAAELAEKHGSARLVTANNVLAHVDDPAAFLSAMARLAGTTGYVVFEVPELSQFIERTEYDTVYHEHLSYFSLGPLLRLMDRAGLSAVSATRVAVHGGSLRVVAQQRATRGNHAPEVAARASGEDQCGSRDPKRWRDFAHRVLRQRDELVRLVRTLRSEGASVAAYGAPAKGSTLLNFCGLDAQVIEFTVDRNPLKVGRFMPGVHIPILQVGELLERQPDYVLILPWNMADEIMEQEAEFRSRGGRFVIPIPTPRIV